jgi:hypothetical protein
MADPVAEKMSQASAEKVPQMGTRQMTKHTPRKGDQYRCERCGMQLTVTTDCKCKDVDHVHLACCGHEMTLT